MKDLIHILTSVSNKIHPYELPLIFDEAAKTLLRQSVVITPTGHFYLREVEFYYFKPETHPDPYTHKNKRQGMFGAWYFHRFASPASFLKSHRNGLDLTFGSPHHQTFGGILLRKIQNVATGEMVVGINKVVRALIEGLDESSLSTLAFGEDGSAFDTTQPVHLTVQGNNHSQTIYKCQRFGLTYKEDERSKVFYKKPLCYYNHDLNLSEIIRVR